MCNLLHLCSVLLSDGLVWKLLCCVYMIIFRRLSSVPADLPKIMEIDTPWRAVEDQSNEYQLHFGWRGTGVISFGQIRQQYWIVSYRWQILWVGGTSGPTRQFSGVGSVLQLWIRRACTLLLMSQGFSAPKWGTYHFWEIHICEEAPLQYCPFAKDSSPPGWPCAP